MLSLFYYKVSHLPVDLVASSWNVNESSTVSLILLGLMALGICQNRIGSQAPKSNTTQLQADGTPCIEYSVFDLQKMHRFFLTILASKLSMNSTCRISALTSFAQLRVPMMSWCRRPL